MGYIKTMKEIKEIEALQYELKEAMKITKQGSDDYNKLQAEYEKWTDVKEKLRDGSRKRGLLDTAVKSSTIVFGLAEIGLTIWLARYSYGKDEALAMCNGKIFNQIYKHVKIGKN